MNKGEIWQAMFIFEAATSGRYKHKYKSEYKTTYVVGDEEEGWKRVASRKKEFSKPLEIKPLKKIGQTNKKI